MNEQLLNALGIRNQDVGTLAFLKYALGEIDGNEGAKILGISSNAFRTRAWRLQHKRGTQGHNEKKTGPKTRYRVAGCEEAIRNYRKKNLSESEISYILKETTGAGVSPATVGRFLRDDEFEKMPRRTQKEKRKAMETLKEIVLDHKNEHREDIDRLGESLCLTSNAGIFLFAPLIENDNLLDIVSPIPERENAKRFFLTILALKLIEKKRRYDINFMREDEGLALFTGSDTVPCASSLHSFDYGMKEETLRKMKTIHIELLKKYMDLSVLHIDFHTTPHFGDSREMETNHIATRGKNMKGALIFLVQDKESRMFPYSNANVKRSEASAEINFFWIWSSR